MGHTHFYPDPSLTRDPFASNGINDLQNPHFPYGSSGHELHAGSDGAKTCPSPPPIFYPRVLGEFQYLDLQLAHLFGGSPFGYTFGGALQRSQRHSMAHTRRINSCPLCKNPCDGQRLA